MLMHTEIKIAYFTEKKGYSYCIEYKISKFQANIWQLSVSKVFTSRYMMHGECRYTTDHQSSQKH